MNLHDRVMLVLGQWKPILKISERVEVRVDHIQAADGSEDQVDCAMFDATAYPEAQGMWDFILMVSPDLAADDEVDLERKIVHELIHLLMEPLRESYFRSSRVVVLGEEEVMWVNQDRAQENWPTFIRRWETVIERIADAFLASAHSDS